MQYDPATSDLFAKHFSGAPDVTAYAPGRVNIIGEHTDYNEGYVMPTPLPLGVSVALSKSDAGIRAVSSLGDGVSVRALDEARIDEWTDYIVGAARVAGIVQGFDIAVTSTLPTGASVSSSAALLVATLRGLRDLFGLEMDDQALARAAQRAENDYVGVNCGLMDQMVSSVGILGKAMVFDTRDGSIEHCPMIAGTKLVTIHSGQTRKLAGNEYNDRRASCEQAARDIGVSSLRDATLADLDKVASDEDRARACHVVTENARVEAAIVALKAQDGAALGGLLNETHTSLSRDFEVSTPWVDEIVAFAQDNGALGARITGAGFGGCVVALVAKGDADAFCERVVSGLDGTRIVSVL